MHIQPIHRYIVLYRMYTRIFRDSNLTAPVWGVYLQILHGAWNIYDAVKGGGSIESYLWRETVYPYMVWYVLYGTILNQKCAAMKQRDAGE